MNKLTLTLSLFVIFFGKVFGQSTFNGTGNWSDITKWTGGFPTSTSTITIANGANCTIDGIYTCASLTFASGNTTNSVVTISSGSSITITAGITYTNPGSNNISQIFNVNDGTATFVNVAMVNTSATRKNVLRINNGTANMSGTFTTPGASGENDIQFTGTGILKYNSGTTLGLDNNELIEGSGTVEFNRAGTQTLAAITYNNVIISGSNTKTMANVTIDSMTINSGPTVTWGGVTTTINGTLVNNGTINFNSATGTKIFVGNVTNNNVWNCSVAVPFEFRGGLSNNGGTFTSGAGLYTFSTNSQDINGTQALLLAGAVTVNSPAVINNYDSVRITGTFTLNNGATWRNQTNSQLNLLGTATITGTMNCDGANNTVYFNSTSAQSSPAGAVYVNLSKTTSSTLTLGNSTISGRLLINTGTIDMGANTITVGQSLNGSGTITQAAGGVLNIGGNNLHSGTHTISTGTVNYNGSSDQTIRNLTYNNLGISGSGIKSLAGNTIVSATLTLSAGSLAINGHTLTLNGTVTTTSGFIRGSNTSKLTIGGAAAAASLSFDQTNQASRSLSNLTNTRTNGITIANALEIIDSINVSNGTITSGGNITLVSTASNTARVARISNGGFSGNIVAQRFIPGGAGKRKWRFLSSPVNNGTGGITLTQYIDDIHVTGMGGDANGFDNCTCLPSIRYYNETLNAIADSGWRNPPTINYQVNTGFAVEVFVRGSRSTPDPFLGTSTPDNATIDYIGEVNSGAININLSYTNNSLANSDGFNLVGNPYPSQIDWEATGWTKTNIDRFFWSYNPDAINPIYGAYDPVSDIGTNDVTRYIPSGIGFFVKANNTGAQLGFTETIKSTSAPYNFFRNTNTSSAKFPHIRLIAGDSLLKDESVIIFDNNASLNAIDSSDIMKLFNPTINFYSKSKENKNLTLNQIPFPTTNKEDTINFSMFVFENNNIRVGAYNLFLKELVDIPDWLGVDILDRYTNTRVDVKNNTYNFNIENVNGAHGNNRLAIIFYRKTTGIDNVTKQFRLYPNPAQNTIRISNFNNNIQSIKIYDLKSTLIKEINQVNASIDVSELINGMYLISIETYKGIEIHKAIINK